MEGASRGYCIPEVWAESQQTEPRGQAWHVWPELDWFSWAAVEAEAEGSGEKQGDQRVPAATGLPSPTRRREVCAG